MDSIVHCAIEEICSQGVNGLTLPNLWPKLQSSFSSHGLNPCAAVKKALWTNLLNTSGLQFEFRGVFYDPQDSSLQSVEESEKLNFKIVAVEHLRNSYVGIYDIKASDAGISLPQRRALERLAIARTNGITQSELAKEFGIKGNNIFYILRNLESRGLIVRQSTILRKKEASSTDREPKNTSIVSTNMLHLYRYAKHLGCQQRLEIIKEDKSLDGNEMEETAASGSGVAEERVKEDVHIKDYLPALKAICDKLEEADGKVLLVSDIKRDLGYRGTPGHRAWRNIVHRLKDARVVEEFLAKVNNKEVICLRLLKKFSPKNFEPKTLRSGGSDDIDTEEAVKLGRRGQINDQLVELPIEHQIYEMIDAEGSKGLTITEVCKRLGLNNKRYYTRLLNMFSRFGMHLQAESHNRGVAYRVWTSRNFNPEASFNNNTLPTKPDKVVFNDDGLVENLNLQENSTEPVQWEEDHLASKASDATTIPTREIEDVATEPEISQRLPMPPALNECNDMLLCPTSSPNVASELNGGAVRDAELQIVAKESLDSPCAILSNHRKRRSYQKYPCLTLNALSTQREQRILEALQEEKFMIKAELHRLLETLEDRNTTMDRKTLERSLNKLQEQKLVKCICVSVPVVTNCGRNRTMDVVLHHSVSHLTPEELGVYERLRSFDSHIRAQGSSKSKNSQSVPELNGVQRILNNEKLDGQAERSEAMRANGFVLAKMVRVKLLHTFLWGYLSNLPCWNDVLLSDKHGYDLKNPHSTCKTFERDAAIKAMPLELYLQIVGSTQKFEDMIEKCRSGLRLSDLPLEEYKLLMGTQQTGRLSYLIDILRRLKLIRMVSPEYSKATAKVPVPHTATFADALELKPYIEEPVLIVPSSSSSVSVDIRPQIRHDFVLSSKKAVEEYWKTLEYCYAAVDSKAALHAFPGSTVHEVFHFRSWATARVMTANQRAELIKRIVNNDPSKKLSFQECENIAKELNLTLDQVLRVYYDKRQKRLTRLQGILYPEEEKQPPNTRRASSSRKRKRSKNGRSSSQHISYTDGQLIEEENSLKVQIDENMEASTEEVGPHETDDEGHSFIRKCALSRLKPTRRKKFSWTEDADRRLVIEYVRHRAVLGPKVHRTDWTALPNMAASPNACRRRMALLNSNLSLRKSVMRLCNILSERYAKHLNKLQNKSYVEEGYNGIVSVGHEQSQNLDSEEDRWDDFNDKTVKAALDEILRHKRIGKLQIPRDSDLNPDSEWLDPSGNSLVSSAIPSKEIQKSRAKPNVSGRRSSYRRLQRKYFKLLNERADVSTRAYKSLAVSNAVELFKLVFLSTSTAPEVPNLLAETLRRYSEHDLFVAFNYLRAAKIMVGGSGTSPFVLSQQFIQRLSASPYPTNTGKRAAKFASWLHEKEKSLTEDGIELPANLQCGDAIYLCSLLSSRELLLSPYLPDQGVGEAEDSRTSKRKCDEFDDCNNDKGKKPKSSLLAGEGEIISRREKGFPGIRLSLSRATISRIDAVDLFKDMDIRPATCLPLGGGDEQNLGLPVDHMKEVVNFGTADPKSVTVYAGDSLWEAMTSYAENLTSNQERGSDFFPELFRTVYSAIQKAGDQGVSMEEISMVMNMQGDDVPEIIIEVLEAFGRALKVNAYDSVHVVDSLYRSKYCLTSLAGLSQDLQENNPSYTSKGTINEECLMLHPDNHEDDGGANVPKDVSMNADDDGHRVTILNLPEEVVQPSSNIQNVDETVEGNQLPRVSPEEMHREGGDTFESNFGKSNVCRPILPWINGDGTINEVVYKGLVRRVLGILMQNPGILEVDIIRQMSIMNPQSCRKLLELMILDNKIIVRKMHQSTSCEPPSILAGLLGSGFNKSNLIFREHFFANPMAAATSL